MAPREKYVNIQIESLPVPVKVVREWRHSMRVSLGQDHLILRLPLLMGRSREQQAIEWARSWFSRKVAKKSGLLERFRHRAYRSGDQLRVGSRNYHLEIRHENRKTSAARVEEEGKLLIVLSPEIHPDTADHDFRKLLSRAIARDFLPEIDALVRSLNRKHFGQPLNRVRLKYNRSNWGSCSGKGNINLSTRLLFAPQRVIEYVIIHELAHLVELNHSKRFWKLVKEASPEYKEREKWLRENGHKCDF
ncbi:MAG: M48 family metallopeptidase [Saprospiraceae bacterium]|nr:M48 family metallopeptidase [Saprospiraceae bacterium]